MAAAGSTRPLDNPPGPQQDGWLSKLAVCPRGDSMSPVALNVFDITIGLVSVSFAIWGLMTAWRGSAYSRMAIELLRKRNGSLRAELANPEANAIRKRE